MNTVATERIKTERAFHLEVYTSGPAGFQATSTLVYGATDLVLIDARFTLSEGRRLADRVKATGKNLTTVCVTHGHPDHYWGSMPFATPFHRLHS